MSDHKWTAELRKISREFDGKPPEPSPAEIRARRRVERETLERQERRAVVIGTAGRVLLVLALAGAINFWPYPHACGPGLFGYLGAEAIIAVGGLWTAVWTWHKRFGRLHILALVIVLWGLVVIAVEVLPRIGYAHPDPARPPQWRCPAQGPGT